MSGGPKGSTRWSRVPGNAVAYLTFLALLSVGATVAAPPARAQSADLVITSLTLSPSTPIQGERVRVTVLLLNKGLVPAQPADVLWYAGENYPEPACRWRMAAALQAKAQQVFTCDYAGYPSWYAQIRSKAVVDPRNEVAESDNANNTTFLPIRVIQPGLPDLTITLLQLTPASPVHGSPVAVKILLENLGTASAAPAYVQWFAVAGQPNASCAWRMQSALAPGGRQLYECTSSYAAANPKVSTLANVDAENAVAESNETNNVKRMPIVVR